MIKKLWQNKKNIIISTIMLLITYSVFVVQAESNDDPGMMGYISGYYTGTPSILPYIMSVPYTFIVSRLYMITTIVPWYAMLFLLISSVAVVVICKCFTDSSDKPFFSFFLFLCVYFSLFLYQLVQMQFTMVAGIAGATCIALVTSMDNSKVSNIKNRWICMTFAAVFMFFAYNIRGQCGLVTLLVLAYIVGGRGIITKCWNDNQVRALFLCILVVILSWASNAVYIRCTGWKQYEGINAERSLFMDTERILYEDNPELYKSIGWDKDVYDLTTSWCFMAAESEYEDFLYLNNAKRAEEKKLSFGEKIHGFVHDVKVFILKSRIEIAMLGGELVIFIVWVTSLFRGRERIVKNNIIRKCVYAFGFIIIQVFLIGYLIVFGRYGTRVLLMIFSITEIPFLLFVTNKVEANNSDKWYVNSIIVGVLIIMTILGVQRVCERKIYNYDFWDAVNEYVMNNNHNIYVGDGSMTSPERILRSFKKENVPKNYFFWGGWLRESPLDKKHMEANGIDRLYLDDMLKENYFFIGNKKNMEKLDAYYLKRYDNVISHIYYKTEDFIVYGYRVR